MSWDQAYSFGDPNAQPPTPTKTPTSAQFPSPTFATPRNTSSNFEDRSGWTPTFAEEYSVFNSTPGRLTTNQHHFIEPHSENTSPLDRRFSNAAHIASGLDPHAHQLTPSTIFPLASVETSHPYSSSVGDRSDESAKKKVTPRKPRKRLEAAFSAQTATPPQTASKGSRKIAPKLKPEDMQNESQNSQYGMDDTPTHQHNLLQYPTSTADLFGYPMSGPATAPAFTSTKPFWDPDTSMAGMGLDFSVDPAIASSTDSHRASTSLDWGRNNQTFQNNVNVPSSQSASLTSTTLVQPTTKRQRSLVPKNFIPPTSDVPTTQTSFDFLDTSPRWDDSFSGASVGGVDPGLLFSRNITSTMPSEFEDVVLPAARPATSHLVREPYQHQVREAKEQQEALRYARDSRSSNSSRGSERGVASSPVKGSARPRLHRSFSESRGKRTERTMLRSGRGSPVKRHPIPSLASISEAPLPKSRTEIRLTVDKKGKARTETIFIDQEEASPMRSHEDYESSHYESSSDEEDIIIPSQNTSFAAPQQPKGPRLARFETSARDNLRHSASASNSYSESSSQQSLESEAETVVEDDDGLGDATRALKKVMESRKKGQMKHRNPRHHRYVSDTRGNQYISYASSSNHSPTTVTDPEGATPSSTRSGTTRCICGQPENEGFMIQCESCENWLHAQCINIDRKSLPTVYICAFCAQTPNMRGGRIRDSSRSIAQIGSSPLAHKSFRSFR